MELRYCELCGDIIKVHEGNEGPPPDDQYLCERCASKKEESGSRTKRKAEDIPLRSAAPTDEPAKSPEPAAAEASSGQAPRVAQELRLDELVSSNELDLFSSETVARRRKEEGSKATPGSGALGKTRIRLLDPDEPSSVATATAEKPPSKAVPKVPAQRLQFLCPACRVTLTVKPSPKPTRLRCPRCRSRMTIDPERRVKLIEVGTQVIKRQEASKGDLLRAPLRSSHPDMPDEKQVAACNESILASKSAADLSELAREKSWDMTAPAYAVDNVNADTELDLKKAPPPPDREGSAKGRPGSARTHEFEPARRAEPSEERGFLSTTAKALLLGGVLAAPFCVWAGLLALANSTAYADYFQAFGELVAEAFQALLGGI